MNRRQVPILLPSVRVDGLVASAIYTKVRDISVGNTPSERALHRVELKLQVTGPDMSQQDYWGG